MIVESLIQSINLVILAAITIVIAQIAIKIITKALSKFLRLFFSSQVVWFMLNVVTFVGTIHHELCHAILAVLTGAKIESMTLFKISKQNLGCVVFRPRGSKLKQNIQLCIVSIAPTVLGTINSLLIFYLAYISESPWNRGWLIYTGVSILINSRMSSADIKLAKEGMPISMLIITNIIFLINMLINFGRHL